jgi:hypothetical protein
MIVAETSKILKREQGSDRSSEINRKIPVENLSLDQGAMLANVSEKIIRSITLADAGGWRQNRR